MAADAPTIENRSKNRGDRAIGCRCTDHRTSDRHTPIANIPKHSTSHDTFNKPLHIRQATTHPTSYHTFNKLLHIPQASAHSTSLLRARKLNFPSRFPPRHLEASRLGGCRNLRSESARGWNNVAHLQLSFPFSSPQFQAGFASICHNRNTLRNT